MQDKVQEIISKINKGNYFDSHYVIDTLIRDYSDDYLRYAAGNVLDSDFGVTEHLHTKIAKIIASFEGTLLRRQSDYSHSYNIRGKASTCVLWERI